MSNQPETPIPLFENASDSESTEKGSVGSVIAILLFVSLHVVGAF